MSDAFSLATSGIHSAVSRATQVAGGLVNASSTGGNSDVSGGLVALKQAGVVVAAEAAVIAAAHKMQKALVDIVV